MLPAGLTSSANRSRKSTCGTCVSVRLKKEYNRSAIFLLYVFLISVVTSVDCEMASFVMGFAF